jgi:NAD-dependent dihydropyrimidine dehydrogenase PreA subunit
MMNQLVYLKDVVTLKLDQKKCTGCGMCLNVCPQAVLSLTNGKIDIANRDACMECGACARNCPVEALNVRSGVGCATAAINSLLGRKKSSCCCAIDSGETSSDPSECSSGANRMGCC